MCCMYYNGDNDADTMLSKYLADAYRRAQAMNLSLVASGVVRPTNITPVIAPGAKDRQPGAFPMKWGFAHPTRGALIFNTRSETAARIPLFASSVSERRCLIPASYYFEWKKDDDGVKTKYAISLPDSPLYMAGLYYYLPSSSLPCFSILTTDAVGGVEEIHERMPLIIPQSSTSSWLSREKPYEEAIKDHVTDLVFKTA